MLHRRRLKQSMSLHDRLATFAKDVREKAVQLPLGAERDDLLQKAPQADTAVHLADWVNSPGLEPPR